MNRNWILAPLADSFMSSFAGVSMVIGGEVHTTPAFDAGTDSGYHQLVVKNYSHTVYEVPNGESIRSGPFIVGGHKWCIRYSPNGGDPSCADFISLHLRLLDNDVQVPVVAQFSFCFANDLEKQKPMYIRATEICSFLSRDPLWGIAKFVRRDVLEQSANLNDDCFTIRCDIMVHNTQDVSDIGQQFYNLLQNKVGADVIFEVGGEKFVAHRCVLAARSTVFMAQLFGPMKEGTTSSVIEIKDMEAKVFLALLSFIYTDSFPKMDKENNVEEEEGQDEEEEVEYVMWLQDLFVAADRYDIQHLKFLCEKQLSKDIGVSSVASTLFLAEQHHCHRLKEACIKFIQLQSSESLEKIMANRGW